MLNKDSDPRCPCFFLDLQDKTFNLLLLCTILLKVCNDIFYGIFLLFEIAEKIIHLKMSYILHLIFYYDIFTCAYNVFLL